MIHVVTQGESIFTIASTYGVSPEQIKYDNELVFDQLVPGQALFVRTMDEVEKLGNMRVSGYAYPFIREDIMREVLLYVEDFLVFSYGFTSLGELIVPEGEDRLIQAAISFGKKPILVLTPFSESGVFDNQRVKLVSEDINVQENLIQNLKQRVLEKGYEGIDVDFEYILPENRENYAVFVGRLQEAMAEQGYQVTVALAPKTSANQQGLLYEGVDYRLLGENADAAFLMTYEWGYSYGPPMAVAPINKVRQVLDYAITEIPLNKIIMGIPNYAYDWPLPYERGVTRATTIGNVEAVTLAVTKGVSIQYDEIAQSPFFQYEENGILHEVWFEDVRSINVKVRTAKEYKFAQIGYWNLMRPFRANWLLLNQLFYL